MDRNQNESPAIWWCYRYDVCILGFGSGQNLMVYFRLSKYSSSWSRRRTARGRWIYVPLWTVLSRDRSLRCTTCVWVWPMTEVQISICTGVHPDRVFWSKSGQFGPSDDHFRGQKATFETIWGLKAACFAHEMALWGDPGGAQRSKNGLE